MKLKDSKPIIGVVGRPFFMLEHGNILGIPNDIRTAIIKSGGVPIVIMPTKDMIYCNNYEKELLDEDKQILDTQIALCDGILMPGGCKIYNYDKYICEVANEIEMPILGICMGMQVMCNYNNDNKNIKIEGHCIMDDSIYLHNIKVDKKSKLYQIVEKEKFKVNSYHNNMVPNSGYYLVCARSR